MDNNKGTMFPINQLRNYARLQVKVWNYSRSTGVNVLLCQELKIFLSWQLLHYHHSTLPSLFHHSSSPQTKTDLIALFDVDMLPSNTLYEELGDQAKLLW